MTWKGLRLAALGGLVWLTLAPSGARAAADLSIAAFFGHWKGSAVSESEISIYFQLTERDIDVIVRPHGQGGFKISWSTVQRQKGDPNAPREVMKQTSATFAPAGRAYFAAPPRTRWRPAAIAGRGSPSAACISIRW